MSEQTPTNISNADFTFKDKYGNTGSNKGLSANDGTKLNNMVKLLNLLLNTPNSLDFVNTLANINLSNLSASGTGIINSLIDTKLSDKANTTDLSNYLRLSGGNVTGNLTVQNKNVVRSVNGVNADAEGNVVISNVVTGTLLPFAGSIIPDGYLIGNGAEVLKASYSDLYSVIGDTYGTASSPDKFKLPDFRGRFMQGANGNLGVYLDAGLPNITGEFANDLNGAGSYWSVFRTDGCFSAYKTDGYSVANINRIGGSNDYNQTTHVTLNASRSSSIYKNGVTTVQPPALAVNILIKY